MSAVFAILGCSSGNGGPAAREDESALGAPTFCAHVAAGPSSADPLLGLSKAHASARFFGSKGDFGVADAALAKALEGGSPDRLATLTSYARGLEGACVLRADDRPLGDASVTLHGDIAFVRPGKGDLVVPTGARAVALDFRDLPNAAGMEDAITNAVAASIHTDLPIPHATFRLFAGMTDEVFSPGDMPSQVIETPDSSVPAKGAVDLPLGVLTGERLPPAAALMAATLRTAGRAWIFGSSVYGAVAESAWAGVGGAGLSVRTVSYATAGAIPDVVKADAPCAAVSGLAGRGAPPAVVGSSTRPPIEPAIVRSVQSASALSPGQLRADLIVAHGAARTFFPDFDVIPSDLDPRFEALFEVARDAHTVDRALGATLLGRLTNAMHDGHSWVVPNPGFVAGVAPFAFERLGPVIAVSETSTADVALGDVLLEVGGRPAAAALADARSRVSASTQGNLDWRGLYELIKLQGPTDFVFRSASGGTKRIAVTPQPTPASAPGTPTRRAGPLADVGAPDLFYVNLDAITMKLEDLAAIGAGIAGARGVILDMRGYPDPSLSWQVVARVLPQTAQGPLLSTTYATPFESQIVDAPPQRLGDWAAYTGAVSTRPVALLVGPATQSQAEHLSLFLTGAKRVTVVGRNSSGTNGTITGVALAGGLGFTFTTDKVRFLDGTSFRGVGIKPDVPVTLTLDDLRAGRDAVLRAAIGALQ